MTIYLHKITRQVKRKRKQSRKQTNEQTKKAKKGKRKYKGVTPIAKPIFPKDFSQVNNLIVNNLYHKSVWQVCIIYIIETMLFVMCHFFVKVIIFFE